MLCEWCEVHRNFLRANGDDSQIVCQHISDEIKEHSASSGASTAPAVDDLTSSSSSTSLAAITARTTSSLSASTGTTTATAPTAAAATAAIATTIRKRKFPSVKEFLNSGDEAMKRKIKPIQKWRTLPERQLYLVRKLIRLPIKEGKDEGHYVEIEDGEGEMLNVWVTDIIKAELDTFSLEAENVYIMPLGEKTAKESGNKYFDFIVKQY